MTPEDLTKLETRYNRACNIITCFSAILLILSIAGLFWWFAWAVAQ